MAEDGDFTKKFLQNQETFQRAPETQAEHRFPARASGIVDVPPGSRGPRSLYICRHGDSFGFTLRHFIIYPPESISETDGRHAAVGALLAPMDTIFVKNVVERGPAKQAGLQRGDRILFVNGESVNNLSYSQVVQKIQSSPRYLHLLVVPKEEDILQKYFAETAHNPVSNQQVVEDRRSNFQVDAVSWRSLQNPNYNSSDYGYLAPRNQYPVQQQKSADNIHSSLREFVAHHHPRSSENIYSTPRDTLRSNDRKSLEIYAEPVINDSTQRPRAQPQVPLYKKMGRRASEGSSAGDPEYSLTCDEIESTMKSSKAPYTQDTYSSLEMPGLYYPAGCRLSLDAGNNRRESSSSLNSFESSSTLTGHETDDSIVMFRLRKSVQEKEDFLKNSLKPSENSLIPREFYSRPKKLEKAVWPPTDPQESPSRLNKPTHQNFQRVKNDIEIEREISQNHETQPKIGSKTPDWQNHIKIQETQDTQTNGTSADAEDRRNYPPNIQMVSRRARQFESGRMVPEDNPLLNDRTSFYKSELARLSEKRAVPNVAVRTREFETMSNEPRRDTSSSSTSSAAVLRRSYRDSRSLDSSDLPNNTNQSNNRMRARSNSTGSWVVAMQTPTETNKPFSDTDTTTGHESMDTSNQISIHPEPPHSPIIPEPVERLHRTAPSLSVTPASPLPQLKNAPIRPTQLDLGAPKRPSRHLRPPESTAETPPPVQTVCADKPLVVRRTKNTNITDEERVMRRESYLRATEGGRIYLETGGDFSDGDVSPQVLRSGSVSGGSSSSVSLEREKVICSSPTEKEKPHFVREGLLHCKITEIDGKRSGDRSWKQVWAVLKGPKLFLFKDRHHQSPVGTSEVAEQSLASGVDMRGSCVQVAEDYTKRKHVLRVSSVLPCRSEVLLQADNPAELAEWVQQLQEQSARNTEIETKLNQNSGSNNKQQAVPQSVPATTSIQVPQNQKSKLPTLRNRSPTGQSPVSKTRKPSQINDPSTSPKSKTWRGRVAKQFRRIHQGGNSPNSPTAPEGSTFGNLIEHCLPSINNTFVPRLVETCTEIVENKGFEIVGIYRVPGNSAAITALTEEVNKCYDDVITTDPRWSDVHVVSSLLKSFFRKMPDSLLTMAAYSNFIEADKLENATERLAAIRRLVKSLPPHNYHTLKHLILHLKKVSEHSTVNKMDAKNLAIVFGPTIVRDGNENMETMVSDMNHQCKIVESLLLQADWFFADDDAECVLPAPMATAELFTTDPEMSLLKDNISKVESLSQPNKEQKMRLKSWTSKYKKKPVKGQNANETKTDSASPNGHKKFPLEEFTNNTTDLKESTIEPKPNVIPTTVTDMESSATESNKDESRRRIGSFIQENIQGQDSVYYYKKGREEYRRRIENFIQETQSNLQRPRKLETSSNNSLEMKSQNSISSSATNVRHSLAVNAISDNRTITKTHSASNVFARSATSAENGRNTIGGSSVQFNKPSYLFASDKQNNAVNSLKDSYSDVSSTSSESRSKHFTFNMRRGGSAENISNTDLNANGNLKKIKYENESDAGQKTGSLDSMNKLSTDDGGDLLTSITKILDEKISSSHKQSPLSLENIPYVDESPEKVSRQSLSYINKENIPSSPKVYRNPSLHKSQYGFSKLLSGYPHEASKLKEKQEDKEKDEDSSLELNLPDNERHLDKLSNKVNILGNSKLKRSESLNKPERTVSPLSNKLKRSESLNKDKLKRSDSLTKNEKTESNISKKREIGSARRATKDFTKLKRKNGMPERSIKRRHTVGGTKDPDKITLLDNRCQEEMNDINENAKEKNMRTSSPDLSSTRRELFFEVNLIGTEDMFYTFRQQLIGTRPQSFPESTVYKVPLESQV